MWLKEGTNGWDVLLKNNNSGGYNDDTHEWGVLLTNNRSYG